MVEIDLVRHNHLIDPQLAIWGWEIPVYLFLGGLTAGVMVLTALLGLRGKGEGLSRWARWLPFAAPALLSAGMLALFLDLEFKLHVYRFYLSFELTSPMSWGSWILVLVYPATLALGLCGLSNEETEALAGWAPLRLSGLGALTRWARGLVLEHAQTLRWANVALGVGLGMYTGILLGALGARAAWSSALLGPLFLVSGVSTGAALIMLFGISEEEHHCVRRWDMLAVGLELVLLVLFLLGLATGGAAARQAAGLFLGGPYTATFWSLVVVLGQVVPLLLEGIESWRGLRPTRLAPVLLLIGGLSLRWILVAAGQA